MHGMARSKVIVLVVMVMMMISPGCESMRFELQSGTTKCITEEIRRDAMTIGIYSVINPSDVSPLSDSHRISARVTAPRGQNYHYLEGTEAGKFAFTAAETGDYLTCFWAPYHNPPIKLSIDFDWKNGFAAHTDLSTVARKGQIDLMELELKKLQDIVKAVHDEMFYLRKREIEMQELNRATNSKMAVFSFFSILICMSVAALQLWHLKSYFQRKKLL